MPKLQAMKCQNSLDIATFNSLFEMQYYSIYHASTRRLFGAFNSLFEMPQHPRVRWLAETVLSILYLRCPRSGGAYRATPRHTPFNSLFEMQ